MKPAQFGLTFTAAELPAKAHELEDQERSPGICQFTKVLAAAVASSAALTWDYLLISTRRQVTELQQRIEVASCYSSSIPQRADRDTDSVQITCNRNASAATTLH
eukprot:14222-Heterococcus_DN1.PRE.2